MANPARKSGPGGDRGGVVMRAHVERLDWMARKLLMLECPFVIRRPQELREALRAVASEAAALAEA
ncbi:MAG: WYL domain-containing protein [Acidobacteria bacterium]|nr:WYL domain-containing protein [Acidobacteriota bacterium]